MEDTEKNTKNEAAVEERNGGTHRNTANRRYRHHGGNGGNHAAPNASTAPNTANQKKENAPGSAASQNVERPHGNPPEKQQQGDGRTRTNDAAGESVAEKQAYGNPHGRSGNKNLPRSERRDGKGKERSRKRENEGETGRTPAETEAAYAPAIYVDTEENKLLDDTYSPLREVEIHDPAAEAEAKRILDEEGPLLFREEKAIENTSAVLPSESDGERVIIVGIRFKKPGKVYYFDPGDLNLTRGMYAIVETARGEEYGEVVIENTDIPVADVVLPLRPVLRVANEEDAAHNEENKAREAEAFVICQQKIIAHELDMKLVEAQYTFDNTKLLFYFTSDGRVDFRDLVKDLASVFRTRIELRQIGIRDEAKLLGGLGTCGRSLCCAGFLADFGQVSIKMAKEQNLSLNATKISGCCGRLMCCLRYEYETYEAEIRLTPPVEALVETPDGRGVVIANHPLRATVTVRFPEVDENHPAEIKTYHRDAVKVIGGVRCAPVDDTDNFDDDSSNI